MRLQSLYLQRRGNNLSFRIAVPPDLRLIVGAREFVKALRTQDRRIATPIALSLAAQAKQLFLNLRCDMAKRKTSNDENILHYSFEFSLDEYGILKGKYTDIQPHETQAVIEHTQAILALSEATTLRQQSQATTLPAPPPTAPKALFNVTLSEAIHDFLGNWTKRKPEMLKKHETTLPMFLEIVGDMPVIELRQGHITKFFNLIQKLPPRWKDKCRQQKINILDLSLQEHSKTIAKGTFNDSYKASMRLFLIEAIRRYQDHGFVTSLTVDGENYEGTCGGENKQRALKPDELKRLFEGDELRIFASDSSTVHHFWLPVLGLFTGARVNELCQINPQEDIFCDEDSGIWCIQLSQDTKAGDGIVKSMKTAISRTIPVHPKLVELGFLGYVAAIKKRTHGRLFPLWEPRGGRAGNNAMKWFTRFLNEIGLHGVANEKGLSLRGMHAFRHTLLTYGRNHKVDGERRPLNLRCISGHRQRSDNPVADGYEDETILSTLADKQELLSQLNYGLTFPIPVLPE